MDEPTSPPSRDPNDSSEGATSFPATLILVHRREKPHKCSVQPLKGRPGFIFHKYPDPLLMPLDGYVRLGFGGPELGPADETAGLLILDATWKLAARMENVYRDVPVRSLPACETAYPRVSRFYDDPIGGLATIEAIYLAYKQLGRDTAGLLDEYYWADAFLERNGF